MSTSRVTAGTPGWSSTTEDENLGKSLLGRLGFAPAPWLRLGVSGAYGPYLVQELSNQMPAGKEPGDYHQKLWMTDLELQSGHVEVLLRRQSVIGDDVVFRSFLASHRYVVAPTLLEEGVRPVRSVVNRPLSTVPCNLSFDGSGTRNRSLALSAFGGYLAGRYDVMRFGDIQDSAGLEHSWDSNVDRYEIGAGYRFNRDVVAKVVHQHTRIDAGTVHPEVRSEPLVVGQLSVSF